MNESYDNSTVVAVLPSVSGGRLRDKALRKWLAQSNVRVASDVTEPLAKILDVLRIPAPEEGLAALRMWGQTGERPTVWVAAADPVYLEPRLDHLCVHAVPAQHLRPDEFRGLTEHLQATLGQGNQVGFIRLGNCGYLRAAIPFSTARVSARSVDQKVPTSFLPSGEGSAAYRNLLSEIEMSLHDHEINQRRVAAGQQPINSLWLWGGGFAPAPQSRPQPRLFADDPLLLGYWDSANAAAKVWPGSLDRCIDAAQGAAFVAVTPEDGDDNELLHDGLAQLRRALRQKRLRRATLLFRDGLRADVLRSHSLRFWRRDSELLG